MPVNPLTVFTCVYGLAEIVGVILVFMMMAWLGYYRGGFAWRSNPRLEFNWHPLCMTIGLVFIFGNAILIYRAFRNNRKKKLKVTHASLNISAVFFIFIGLQAVFDSHNLADPPIPNLYSFHSWLGILTVAFFSCQWVFGFVTFMFPGVSLNFRSHYLPFHFYFGLFIFVCSTITCLLGLMEKAIFSVKNYGELPPEGILINVIGLHFIVFAAMTVYLVLEPKYRREPIPEDAVLLTSNEMQEKSK